MQLRRPHPIVDHVIIYGLALQLVLTPRRTIIRARRRGREFAEGLGRPSVQVSLGRLDSPSSL